MNEGLQQFHNPNVKMNKNNLNIVVFDEEESFAVTDQSRFNNSIMRRQTSEQGLTSQGIVQNEIQMLHEKIRNLQEKSDRIQETLKSSAVKSGQAISSSTSIAQPQHHGSSHVDELLKVIETKIKVILEETNKILQRLTQEFDRKIGQGQGQKQREHSAIGKIQQHCRDSISQVQRQYQEQLMIVKGQHEQLEIQLIERVDQIERELMKKSSMFSSKEQEYLSTIEHLEHKIRAVNKNKRMIEVTQQKGGHNMEMGSRMLENISGIDNTNNGHSMRPTSPLNTSNSKRRTKIFEGKKSNRSVSPHNADDQGKKQILSPLKAPTLDRPKQTQSLAKSTDPRAVQNPVLLKNAYSSAHPQLSQQFRSSQSKGHVNQQIKKTEAPRNKIQDQSQQQFLKDVPKAHWERFQDFDENESSGSEEDVFFYPEHIRAQNPEPEHVSTQSMGKQRMNSPFDIN